MRFNKKNFFWVTCPSSDFKEDRGNLKESVVSIVKDTNHKYSKNYCVVILDDNTKLRVKGSMEEIAEKFWKSRALSDKKGGY